jgi:hypothetical protein
MMSYLFVLDILHLSFVFDIYILNMCSVSIFCQTHSFFLCFSFVHLCQDSRQTTSGIFDLLQAQLDCQSLWELCQTRPKNKQQPTGQVHDDSSPLINWVHDSSCHLLIYSGCLLHFATVPINSKSGLVHMVW